MDLYEDLRILTNSLAFDPENHIKNIAKLLLSKFVFKSKTAEFRLADVEFYVYQNQIHPDKSCYYFKSAGRNTRQLLFLHWYVHGAGIDLTLGNGFDMAVGVLIRKIVRLDGTLLHTGGPWYVRKKIEEITSLTSDQLKYNLEAKNVISNEYLSILQNQTLELDIISSKRINLEKNFPNNQEFNSRNYRFYLK